MLITTPHICGCNNEQSFVGGNPDMPSAILAQVIDPRLRAFFQRSRSITLHASVRQSAKKTIPRTDPQASELILQQSSHSQRPTRYVWDERIRHLKHCASSGLDRSAKSFSGPYPKSAVLPLSKR